MTESADDLQAQLAITEEDLGGGAHVLALKGELDLSTVGRLGQRLDKLIGDGASAIVVDLIELTFIDSTGLATLLNALRNIHRRQGRLALACTNPTVLRLFEITGTNETFNIFADRGPALERVREPAD